MHYLRSKNTLLTQPHPLFVGLLPPVSSVFPREEPGSATPLPPSVCRPSSQGRISPSLTVLLLCVQTLSTTSTNPLILLRLSRGTIENPGLIGPMPMERPLRTDPLPRGRGNDGWVSEVCNVERRRFRERPVEGESRRDESGVVPLRVRGERGGEVVDISGSANTGTSSTVGARIRRE